jgi:acetoin utilization protein AcuB
MPEAGGTAAAHPIVMLMPAIGRYMTKQPWTVPSNISLFDASELMRQHGIRHLPVVDDGELVGLVSDRDLRLAHALGGRPSARVRDAMTEPAFSVNADDPIADVARMMSERKYGSAVVVTRSGVVEGIFTAVDACRALAELLERAVA